MKLNFAKNLSCLLALILLLSINVIPVSASNIPSEAPTTITLNESDTKVFNLVWLDVIYTKSGSDDIKIIAHNIGVDTVDGASLTVKITNSSGHVSYHKKVTFSNILPIFSPTHNIYVKNWSKIEITDVQAWDGSDFQTNPNRTIIRSEL